MNYINTSSDKKSYTFNGRCAFCNKDVTWEVVYKWKCSSIEDPYTWFFVGECPHSDKDIAKLLAEALFRANDVIFEKAKTDTNLLGMGSTEANNKGGMDNITMSSESHNRIVKTAGTFHTHQISVLPVTVFCNESIN